MTDKEFVLLCFDVMSASRIELFHVKHCGNIAE